MQQAMVAVLATAVLVPAVAAEPHWPTMKLDLPCMPGPVAEALFTDIGMAVADENRLTADGVTIELWRSSDPAIWQLVMISPDEAYRCPVAGNAIEMHPPPSTPPPLSGKPILYRYPDIP